MRHLLELDILHISEDTGKPTAYSYHPSALSREALTIIINNQINEQWPWEIHYYQSREFPRFGVYKTIDAGEFVRAKDLDPEARADFVRGNVSVLKNLDTADIIFAEPLIPKEPKLV